MVVGTSCSVNAFLHVGTMKQDWVNGKMDTRQGNAEKKSYWSLQKSLDRDGSPLNRTMTLNIQPSDSQCI